MKSAIDSRQIEGTTIYVCKTNETLDFKNDFKFPNISSYHSFEYYQEFLLAFRYYNIGAGLSFEYKSLISQSISYDEVIAKINIAKLIMSEGNQGSGFCEIINKSSNLSIFKWTKCPFIGFSENNLDTHSLIHLDKNSLSQRSKIKLKYANMLIDIRKTNIKSETTFIKDLNKNNSIEKLEELKRGFAINVITRTRFNEKQKKFLIAKFNIGEKNNSLKVDPKDCEREMILMYDFFKESERLSSDQIRSYFKKLSNDKKNCRYGNEEDENEFITNRNINIIKNKKKLLKIQKAKNSIE